MLGRRAVLAVHAEMPLEIADPQHKLRDGGGARAGVPLPRGHVGGYSGFQPRVPPADTAEWVRVTSLSDDPAYMPPDPAVAGRATFN